MFNAFIVCCRTQIERVKEVVRLKTDDRSKGSIVSLCESRRSSEDSTSNSKAIAKGVVLVSSRDLLHHITPPSERIRSTLPSEMRRQSTIKCIAQHSGYHQRGRRATAPPNISIRASVVQVCISCCYCYSSE